LKKEKQQRLQIKSIEKEFFNFADRAEAHSDVLKFDSVLEGISF